MFLLIAFLAFVSRTLALNVEKDEIEETPDGAPTVSTREVEIPRHERASLSSSSIFSAYMRGWASFQRNPPWVGSCHQQSEKDQQEEKPDHRKSL